MLLKHTPAPGTQRGPGARIGGGEPGLERAQAQELQEPPVLPGGLAEVVSAVDHVHLSAREEVEDPLELLRVLAPVAVGMMPVRKTLVDRVRADRLDVADQTVDITRRSAL